MNLQIDKAKQLLDELLNKGWVKLGSSMYDNYPYYAKDKYPVAIGQNIRLNPRMTEAENIDNYFKRLMSRIVKYGIRKFIVFGGNTGVAIPEYFIDFCKKNGVEIVYIQGDETIDQIIDGLNK